MPRVFGSDTEDPMPEPPSVKVFKRVVNPIMGQKVFQPSADSAYRLIRSETPPISRVYTTYRVFHKQPLKGKPYIGVADWGQRALGVKNLAISRTLDRWFKSFLFKVK